ncbi:hypothetical protein PMEGAS228_13620 [Priestia megaterium]
MLTSTKFYCRIIYIINKHIKYLSYDARYALFVLNRTVYWGFLHLLTDAMPVFETGLLER